MNWLVLTLALFVCVAPRQHPKEIAYFTPVNLRLEPFLDGKATGDKILARLNLHLLDNHGEASMQVVQFRPTLRNEMCAVVPDTYSTEVPGFPEMEQFQANDSILVFDLLIQPFRKSIMKIKLRLKKEQSDSYSITELYGSQLCYFPGKEEEPHLVEWKTIQAPYIELPSRRLF
jgi:hypothetical protein